MNNLITNLEINNFKSIKHIKMDCKRVNVLIGKPNVGKSNILEALSLFQAPYSDPNKKFLEDYIRYEKLSNLFYDQDRKNLIEVVTDLGFAALWNNNNSYRIAISPDNKLLDEIKLSGTSNLENNPTAFFNTYEDKNIHRAICSYHGFFTDDIRLQGAFINLPPNYNPIKKYHFKTLKEHKNSFPSFLNPPFGDNLFTILEGSPELWEECGDIFNQYGLDLLLDTENEKIDVQKKVGRRVSKIPYSLAADTLQRYIFHIAAIETNSDSVLLLEEPESHSFPPYISRLAEKIVEAKSNQFFIATHSPYMLTPFIEQCPPEDVSIFIASYENYETVVKALSKEEIENIMDTGIDLFFNISAFQK